MNFDSNYTVVLTPDAHEDRRQRLTAKARRMAELPAGFSYGDGVPVTGSAIAVAEQLILLASQLELDADVFPNLDGGCAVAFYNYSEKVEVSVNAGGDRANLTFERGIGFQYEDVISPMEDVGFVEIMRQALKLRRFDNNIWKLSASSICVTSTVGRDASATSSARTPRSRRHLLLQTEEAGSLCLNMLVPA